MSDGMMVDCTRIADGDTIRRDITAWELARLMVLHVSFTEAALAGMSEQDRQLVERNSRPVAGLVVTPPL
jgi:hypothetical protein